MAQGAAGAADRPPAPGKRKDSADGRRRPAGARANAALPRATETTRQTETAHDAGGPMAAAAMQARRTASSGCEV